MTGGNPLSGRDTVLGTLDDLVRQLRTDPAWENLELDRYLETLSALLASIENHYANTDRPIPDNPWAIMAEALKGARDYE
ncbi:hypothetical protein Lesp02_75190 [Lentzea sp. NBRC 105346]|uniref:DUF7660 family protein n=1 Tax=Lentzea sp. NBRC 105346 TaxID=3032205 RepID=UPI0024A0DEAA|nr:hypothetical protein [Lentzea sp. NBRC 105346]GLZ35332.1 hypothetical protein Lesp02_75190 [Lentzea sp. NBRC 105346]